MQKVMDTYAGGIGSHYQFNEKQLELAKQKIEQIITLSGNVSAADYHGLMFVYELKERHYSLSGAYRAFKGKKGNKMA